MFQNIEDIQLSTLKSHRQICIKEGIESAFRFYVFFDWVKVIIIIILI